MQACWTWGILLSPEDFALLNATYVHEEKLGEPDKGINYREFIALMRNHMLYSPGGGSGEISASLGELVRSKVRMHRVNDLVDNKCALKCVFVGAGFGRRGHDARSIQENRQRRFGRRGERGNAHHAAHVQHKLQ